MCLLLMSRVGFSRLASEQIVMLLALTSFIAKPSANENVFFLPPPCLYNEVGLFS